MIPAPRSSAVRGSMRCRPSAMPGRPWEFYPQTGLDGIMADENILSTRQDCGSNAYVKPRPALQLVPALCHIWVGNTPFGSLRSFGDSFELSDFNKNFGFQLYMS